MYILPALTYLEVGRPGAASKIICFEHFKWEPAACPSLAVAASLGFVGTEVTSGRAIIIVLGNLISYWNMVVDGADGVIGVAIKSARGPLET